MGAEVELEAIPRPVEAEDRLLDWLLAFPSYGFILAVRPEHVTQIRAAFAAQNITCAVIGQATAGQQVILRQGDTEAVLWDFAAEPFTGFSSLPN